MQRFRAVQGLDLAQAVQVGVELTTAPRVEDQKLVRPVFERARELFDDIRREGVGTDRFNILSMGMSADFEIAVECGANVVRVGASAQSATKGDGNPSATCDASAS